MTTYTVLMEKWDNLKDYWYADSNLSAVNFLRAAQRGELENLKNTWDNLSDTGKRNYLNRFHAFEFKEILLNSHFHVAEWLLTVFSPDQKRNAFFGNFRENPDPNLVYYYKIFENGNFTAAKWFYDHAPHDPKSDLLMPYGYNALYFAATKGNEEAVEWVLKECGENNFKKLLTTNGNTAYKYCSQGGSINIVKRLHNLALQFVDPKTMLDNLKTLFHYVSTSDNSEQNIITIWDWIVNDAFNGDLTAIRAAIRGDDYHRFRVTVVAKQLECANWIYNIMDSSDRSVLDAYLAKKNMTIEEGKIINLPENKVGWRR